jgi:hypothetical protein
MGNTKQVQKHLKIQSKPNPGLPVLLALIFLTSAASSLMPSTGKRLHANAFSQRKI